MCAELRSPGWARRAWVRPATRREMRSDTDACLAVLLLPACCAIAAILHYSITGSRCRRQEKRHCTIRFGSATKVLAECKLKYYRISECTVWVGGEAVPEPGTVNVLGDVLVPAW